MGDDLRKLAEIMQESGFKTDAKALLSAIQEIDVEIAVLHLMKDDGLDISDETIARIRNAWLGN